MSRQIIRRREAAALGLKRYFTGKPCPAGHISERSVLHASCWECHLTRAREHCRKRNLADPEPNRERAGQWQRDHRDRRNARNRVWYAKNRERLCKEARQRSADGRYSVLKSNSKARRRLKIKDAGSFTRADIKRIFKAQRGKCAECRTSLKQGYQVDHIVPIAKGGSNFPRNIQLMCSGPCNQKKGSMDPVDFARSVGRLV
jgi:5-methylcytosine-specific restriction endonuclease McrA